MKKSNEEKRVVIYCRESRDDYGENYERIETQRDLLVKYCKSHGYTNIVDIIMDDDKSGTDFSRFDDIRERTKNKEIDVIVFKNSARLGRNQKEALDFVEYLEEQGVEIIFEDEQYNEEMFGLYAWFNERRARDDSKNIRRNLRHKIEEGDLLVKAIYGYNKDGKNLVINEEMLPPIFTYKMAKAFSDHAVKLNKTVKFNIAVDTGMSRIGYIPSEEAVNEVVEISKLPNVEIESAFTHFAKADYVDKSFAEMILLPR